MRRYHFSEVNKCSHWPHVKQQTLKGYIDTGNKMIKSFLSCCTVSIENWIQHLSIHHM